MAIRSGRTGEIITLACFGALSLYILSMASLFILRRTEPELARPFRAVAYPVFPALALAIAAISLVAMTLYNLAIAGVFFAIMAAGALYFLVLVRPRLGAGWRYDA